MIVKALYYGWMILLGSEMLMCSVDFSSLSFEPTDICPDINLDVFYSDYFDTLDSLARDIPQNVLQEEQATGDSRPLEVPGASKIVNSVDVIEELSTFISFPATSTSTASSISSVQVQSPVASTKRACNTAEKKDRKQRARKQQKTNTTVTEANSVLIDEVEVRMAVEKFNRYFGDDKKVSIRLPPGITEFAENLVQRGLASVHSREIMELCTASEKWLGHNIFWRMLIFFMGTQPLYLTNLNQLEDKNTIVLRDKLSNQPLSESSNRKLQHVVAKFRDAERMEIQCSLSILEGKGTTNVLGVLRWLLYHVNIRCVGITCDLREAGMNSAVLGRQMAALTKERRESRVHVDSLALHFKFADYMAAAKIINQCPSISVLKIHVIGVYWCQVDDINQALKALLLHCPALPCTGTAECFWSLCWH
ncbi:hypothetical protein NECID01_1807 [Nematocida sp. AWRm77]|nr:hypothetical protein NECID01_1807 [Nematocida sp. AWRm77]